MSDFRDNLQDEYTPIDKQLKPSAQKLDALIMKPVRQLLGETRTILLSPDSALNLIPFEALVDEKNRYLVETYAFTYLTSGRDLLRLQNKSPSQQSPLVLADPAYNRAGEVIAAINPKRSLDPLDLSKMSFPRLQGTAEEAKVIQELFPDAQVLTRSQATENVLKQANRPYLIHLATHGFFLPAPQTNKDNKPNPLSLGANLATPQSLDNPLLRSGLVLAGAKLGQSAGDNGVLTALEATTLKLLGTKLVVLSACETGLGGITTGEGVYGLRRALVIAGTESQVISLWKVDDSATKELMVAYYQRLKENEGRTEALRQLQLEWLGSENYQHPYYWASFIPSGDWTPMRLK